METILKRCRQNARPCFFRRPCSGDPAYHGRYMTDPSRCGPKRKRSSRQDPSDLSRGPAHGSRERLKRVLDVEADGRTLIFCQTKKEVDDLLNSLQTSGYPAGAIHAITRRSSGRGHAPVPAGHTRILVATDVAARGIDIPDVTHVINFGLPNNLETYVHRIGRTGRVGKTGTAITLATPLKSAGSG